MNKCKSYLFLLIFLSWSINLNVGYKFLLYSPKFGGSHVTFMGKIADVLAQGGHDVVKFYDRPTESFHPEKFFAVKFCQIFRELQ